MITSAKYRPDWWGGDRHKIFTVVVFIILASLDNAARGVFPPLYAVMAQDLGVDEAALGLISAMSILVLAVTALLWGYWGDKGHRKQLLLVGTLIWSGAMFMTGLARSYEQLLLWQLITAVGIGCISAVGFSVISDFISPVRRGLAMSFWGLSQGGGGGAGALLGGFLGAHYWPIPFFVIAIAGFFFAVLYFFTFEPQRGHAEPELAQLYASGRRYTHRIQRLDLKRILGERSNQWLLLQAFLATLVYGSLVWMPRLFIARVQAEGYNLEVATMSGNFLSLLFQTGFYFAILAGHIGDRWQRRRADGRAWFCAIATVVAIPFQIAVFFIPLRGLSLPPEGGPLFVALATGISIISNPWILLAFLLALVAVAFSSADIPNRNALLTDLNLPEHRGTVIGMQAIATGLGVAAGNALAGFTFEAIAIYFASPWNYAIGLALFQLFFIPAAWAYYQLTRSAPEDIAAVRRTLRRRAEQIP